MRRLALAVATMLPFAAANCSRAQIPAASVFDSTVTLNPATNKLGVAPATPTQLGGVMVSTGLQAAPSGAVSVAYGRAPGTALQGSDPAVPLALSALQPVQTAAPSLLLANGTTVALGNLSMQGGALLAPSSSGAAYSASGSGLTLNSGVFALSFPAGVTPPSTLPRVAATGAYADLTGLPPLLTVGQAAGTARDAAAALAAEASAASVAASAQIAAASEASRAQAAEAALLPRASTFAGLPIIANPTAAQVTAALPLATTGAAGLAPPLPGNGATFLAGNGSFLTPPIPVVGGAGPVSIGGTPLAPTVGLAFAQGVTPPAALPKSAATGVYSDLAGLPALGSASSRAATDFDGAGAASAAAATEQSRAQAAESALLPKAATFAGLSLGSAPSSAQLLAAINGIPATSGDTTHLVLGNGSSVGLGNLSTSNGALQAPTTTVTASGPVAVTGPASSPIVSLAFGQGITAPATLPRVAATGAYSDLAGLPVLGSAAGQSSAAFDAAGTATSAAAGETSRAQAAEAGLTPKTATFGGLQLGSAPTAPQVLAAINAVPATAGDTTHLLLANGTSVGLGNLTMSSGALVAPSSSGASTVVTSAGPVTITGPPTSPVVNLAFASGVTVPSTLPKVAATGAYADLGGLPTLGTAAGHASGDFDVAGAALSETSRAQSAEATLAPKTATFGGLQLGSAPTAPQVLAAINAVPATSGDTTHLLLSSGAPVALGNLAVSNGVLAAPTTLVTSGGPVTVGGTSAAPVVGLAFASGVTAPSTLPKVAATGAYADLGGLPTLGTAAGHASGDFDVAGAALSETSRAQSAEATLAPKTATFGGLQLGSAPTAPQVLAAINAVPATSGDTTHLLLGSGAPVALGNLAVSNGVLAAPTTVVTSGGPVTVGGTSAAPIVGLAFGSGITAPSTLPKVVATGAYADLGGLPTLGSAAAHPATDFDASGAASAVAASTVARANNLSDLSNPSTARGNLGLGALATAGYPAAGLISSTGSGLAPVTLGSNLSMSGNTLNAASSAAATLPSATATQLFAGTGAVNAAQAVDVGANLQVTTPQGAPRPVVSVTGVLAQDANGTINSQRIAPAGAAMLRTASARAGDTFNPHDAGAIGTGTGTTLAQSYYASCATSVAGLAGCTAPGGGNPFAWANVYNYGLTFPMTVSVAAALNATSLQFISALTGASNPQWAGHLADWQDPGTRYMLPSAGMLITGTGIPAGAQIGANGDSGAVSGWTLPHTWGIAALPVRAGELLMPPSGADTWVGNSLYAGVAYFNNQYIVRGSNIYRVTNAPSGGGYTGSNAPSGTGSTVDNQVTWVYVSALPNVGAANATLRPTWASGTAYVQDDQVVSNGNVYQANASGTSVATPSGRGSKISDSGALTWLYLGPATLEADWRPGVTVPPGAEMAANGGHWYQAGTSNCVTGSGTTIAADGTNTLAHRVVYGGPVYAGSYNLPWSNSYYGTNVTDGSCSWYLISREDLEMMPLGTINLVNGSGASIGLTQAVAAGATPQFTLPPAAVGQLTMDYIGVQTAMYEATQAAFTNGLGADVDLDAGVYVINHPLLDNAQLTDTGAASMVINGHGETVTRLLFTYDFGPDQFGLGEGNNAGANIKSRTKYREFAMVGPQAANNIPSFNGTRAVQMDGLSIGETAIVDSLDISGVHSAIRMVDDHQVLTNVTLSGACGISMGSYTNNVGNLFVNHGGIAGTVASICISPTNQIDASTFQGQVHLGFGPYGFYASPKTPNLSAIGTTAISNSTLQDVEFEQTGEEPIRMRTGNGDFGNNHLIGSGLIASIGYPAVAIPDGFGGKVQARAGFLVENMNSNTFVGWTMAAYGNYVGTAPLAEAAYEAESGCTGNLWLNDPSFVTGIQGAGQPTTAVPPLKCKPSNGVAVNRWANADGEGEFHHAGGHYAAGGDQNGGPPFGTGLTLYGGSIGQAGDYTDPWDNGDALLGFSAAPCIQDVDHLSLCAVQTRGHMDNVSTYGGQQINNNRYFSLVSDGGGHSAIQEMLDNTGAMGTVIQGPCSPCSVLIDPLMGSGSHRATRGITAGTAGAPTLIYAKVFSFSTVPAGGTGQLFNVPIGESVKVVNHGTNPLAMLPPSGANFEGLAANAAAGTPVPASGGEVVFTRTGLLTWEE